MKKKSESKQSKLPEFENPPISEVIVGVFFKEPLVDLKVPHFGIYWDTIKNKYPHCDEADPLAWRSGQVETGSPRVWFINKKKTSLIQIQRDCFLFNWRVAGNEKYPRYNNVIKEFSKQFNNFSCFLDDQSLSKSKPEVVQCELTYINHIPVGEIWQAPSEIGKIIPDLKWRRGKRFLREPVYNAWAGAFALPEDYGQLTVSVKYGTKQSDGTPVYTLEFSAKGLGGDGSDKHIKNWFNIAHEWIVRGFCDFTDKKIQQECWGRKG